MRVEEEARRRADELARVEEEARLRAMDERRLQAEEEARLRAEAERLRVEQERLLLEESMRRAEAELQRCEIKLNKTKDEVLQHTEEAALCRQEVQQGSEERTRVVEQLKKCEERVPQAEVKSQQAVIAVKIRNALNAVNNLSDNLNKFSPPGRMQRGTIRIDANAFLLMDDAIRTVQDAVRKGVLPRDAADKINTARYSLSVAQSAQPGGQAELQSVETQRKSLASAAENLQMVLQLMGS